MVSHRVPLVVIGGGWANCLLGSSGKPFEELVPKAVRVAVLVDPANATSAETTLRVQEVARTLGLQIHVLNATTIGEIDAAFATCARPL
jgi:hypothetical protein